MVNLAVKLYIYHRMYTKYVLYFYEREKITEKWGKIKVMLMMGLLGMRKWVGFRWYSMWLSFRSINSEYIKRNWEGYSVLISLSFPPGPPFTQAAIVVIISFGLWDDVADDMACKGERKIEGGGIKTY